MLSTNAPRKHTPQNLLEGSVLVASPGSDRNCVQIAIPVLENRTDSSGNPEHVPNAQVDTPVYSTARRFLAQGTNINSPVASPVSPNPTGSSNSPEQAPTARAAPPAHSTAAAQLPASVNEAPPNLNRQPTRHQSYQKLMIAKRLSYAAVVTGALDVGVGFAVGLMGPAIEENLFKALFTSTLASGFGLIAVGAAGAYLARKALKARSPADIPIYSTTIQPAASNGPTDIEQGVSQNQQHPGQPLPAAE